MLIELLVYVLLILIQMIMNKKFSTLVAGVLLASGVGASAQTFNPQVFSSEPEIRQAKYYALGVGSGATNVVSVTETADGTLAF